MIPTDSPTTFFACRSDYRAICSTLIFIKEELERVSQLIKKELESCSMLIFTKEDLERASNTVTGCTRYDRFLVLEYIIQLME